MKILESRLYLTIGNNHDVILAGERLYTMSCSDKLARWNLLGMHMQGALLSLYVDPNLLS